MPKFTASLNLPKYATAPASPSNGDVYYNTTDNKVYSRINGAWVDLAAGGGSGNVVYYQNDAPSTANDGDIWIDANDDSFTATGPAAVWDVITNAATLTSNNYTLVLSDKDKLVEMNSASANTLTVPLNSTAALPVGTQIHILQTNTGQTTVTPATAGVIINSALGLKLRTRWSSATLIKRATDTWVLLGDCTL